MRFSIFKSLRSSLLNAAWTVRGQAVPALALSMETWLARGGAGALHELSPRRCVEYPARTLRGAVEAILPAIHSLPPELRQWYHDEWDGNQQIDYHAKRVAELQGGRVFSYVGLVCGQDNVQIANFSGGAFAGLFEHSHYYHERRLPPACRVRGSVAVLACGIGYRNYYHWVTEILPRIGLLRQAGIEPDYYFLPVRYRYHRDSLAALGIGSSRVIPAHKYSHIQADVLYATPNVRIQIEPDNARWLYEAMASQPWSKVDCPRRKNIYVARRHNDPRTVVNEKELLAALRRWNFEKQYLEDLTVRQQIEMFQQADFVIGPHGAGLVNTVFCNPGTCVLEIGTPVRPSGLFYYIAHNRGLRYCGFYGDAVAQHGDESDIRVEIDGLMAAVAEMHETSRAVA